MKQMYLFPNLASVYAKLSTLQGTDAGQGANLIGVQDADGNFVGTTVEAALKEIADGVDGRLKLDQTTPQTTVGTFTFPRVSIIKADSTGETDLLINPTTKTSGRLADVQVGGNSYFFIDTTAGGEGGRGWINVTNPTADASGSGVKFSSATGTYTGLFQLDSTGQMVFRNRANAGKSIYFDANSDVNFRTNSTSSVTTMTIKGTGLIGIGTTAPTHTLTLPSTSTGIALYNTADQTTNYERARFFWSGNVFNLSTEFGGTQGARNIVITNTSNSITLSNASGAIDISRTASGLDKIVKFGSNLSSSSIVQAPVSIISTIAQSGTAGYTALLINPTETATGSGAKNLIDAQVGGVSKFKVDNTGVVSAQGYKSSDASAGVTETVTIVTDTRMSSGQLQKKTQVLTYKNGLLTNKAAESDWIDSTDV